MVTQHAEGAGANGIAGQVALVTGAGSGIGEAVALAFAAAGARVMVADVDSAAAAQTAARIASTGGEARHFTCDVSDEHQVHDLVDHTVATFGGLDIAHNNAGIIGASAKLAEHDVSDWHRVIGINLTGVFLCMREELRVMVARGRGAIVNTSSNAGFRGLQALGPYVASKHGVIGLTKSAAVDYAPLGIRINAVCPGATDSPLLSGAVAGSEQVVAGMVSRIPLGRFARPREIADAVVWLCSDGAAYITGTTLLVDGGNTAT